MQFVMEGLFVWDAADHLDAYRRLADHFTALATKAPVPPILHDASQIKMLALPGG